MSEPIEGEVLEQMPEATPAAPRALAIPTDNPYLAMAGRALDMGKVDQLDKLLDLQLKWDAEQQRKAFVAAMSDFKAEAGGITIAKSKHVSFRTDKGVTQYDHAELHDITRALVPIMAKHGLSHRWDLDQSGAIKVTCIISHRDGHKESVSMQAAADKSGGKNDIQSIASTKTYLERYTLLAATGMATGGELDNDGRDFDEDDPPLNTISEEQEIILRDLIDAHVTNKPKFMEWMKVEKLSDLLASNFDVVHAQLARIAGAKTNG